MDYMVGDNEEDVTQAPAEPKTVTQSKRGPMKDDPDYRAPADEELEPSSESDEEEGESTPRIQGRVNCHAYPEPSRLMLE